MPDLSRRHVLGSLLGGAAGLVLADDALAGQAPEPVLVLACHIAGTTYRPNRLADVEPYLAQGARLLLEREPRNPADALAIAVYNPPHYHLGYIPRADNQVLARLMDHGIQAHARLESKQWVGNWLKVGMIVFLALPILQT
jgi:hypothetical protein